MTDDYVIIVLGHCSCTVWEKRVRKAARLAARRLPRAVIFSGYASDSSGLSEALQMASAWPGPEVPMLLEEAAISTVENATRSLPIICALGGVRHVSVVTSFWHLHAFYHFRPYRKFRLHTKIHLAWSVGPFLGFLVCELGGLRHLRSRRSIAYRDPCLTLMRGYSTSKQGT